MSLLACCPSWFAHGLFVSLRAIVLASASAFFGGISKFSGVFTPSRSRPRVESAARPDVNRCEIGKVVLNSGVWPLSRIVQHRVLEYDM
ncbi:hypothetical protein B0T26DRAFT_705995, partial [Lasiosphaeria miniovina]